VFEVQGDGNIIVQLSVLRFVLEFECHWMGSGTAGLKCGDCK